MPMYFRGRPLPEGSCKLELNLIEAGAVAAAIGQAKEQLRLQALLGDPDSAVLAKAEVEQRLEGVANAVPGWNGNAVPQAADATEGPNGGN